MARRVVSVVRAPAAALRASDRAVEATAYALAEEVALDLVLSGPAVELAVAGAEVRPAELAGTALPPSASGQDLRGLLESGVNVHVAADDLAALGMVATDLVAGVRVAEPGGLAVLLAAAEAVVCW